MATARAYIPNRTSWERMIRSVRRTESALVPRRGRAVEGPRVKGAHHNWVRITSETLTGDGHYPGLWCQFNAADNSFTDGEVIWVREVDGGKLHTGVHYLGRLEGPFDDEVSIYGVKSATGGATTFDVSTSTTNAAVAVATLVVDSTGTPAAGFGGKIVYNAETSTPGTFQNQGSVEQTWVTATAGNVTSQTTIKNYFNNTEVTVLNAAPGGTTVTATTTSTAAPVTAFTVKADSTGTPAAGFGPALALTAETATPGTFADPLKVTATWTTATAGAEVSQAAFTVLSAGAANTPLTLQPNAVLFGGGATATQARFLEPSGGGTAYVGFTAPALAANVPLTLPNALPAGDGYVWYADTDGTTYFDAAPSGTISGLTTDVLPKATSSTTIGDSSFFDDGTDITIGDGTYNSVTIDADDIVIGSAADTLTITLNCDDLNLAGDLNVEDGRNINFDTTTGTMIGAATGQKFAFHGATPIAQETVTGSRGGNAALADLLTKLANKGLIVDGTS